MSQRSGLLGSGLLGAFLSLLLLCGVAVSQAQKPQNSSRDEAAIRQIVRQVQDGWNAHDGRAFAAPFAADADYVVVNGMRIKGRSAIAQGHVAIFTTIYKESQNTATIKSIRFLRPDVALAHVEWNLEVGPSGQKARAINTMVLTRESGKWSIAAFQNTPVQETSRGSSDRP